MDTNEKLKLFEEQISCGAKVFIWHYTSEMELLYTNCPYSEVLDDMFEVFGQKALLRSRVSDCRHPMIMGTDIGLCFGAAFGRADEGEAGKAGRIYLVGPVFTTEMSPSGLVRSIRDFARKRELNREWADKLIEALKLIPPVMYNIITLYSLILHFCVTGEKLDASEFEYSERENGGLPVMSVENDRSIVWQTEQAMLRAVSEGDPDYKKLFVAATNISNGIRSYDIEDIRRAKNSVIIFTTLCARAAIQGGMSPEQAYALGDAYIEKTEAAKKITDVATCSHSMYTDFVTRMHSRRVNPEVSPQINSICEYIEMHLEEPLTTAALAKRVGYAEYYFTRKFKAETKSSLAEYIQYARIARAKLLLATSAMSIPEIAEKLQFGSRSYFSTVFSKVVGCSPADYRSKNKRI